jgi:hypothetical protein
VDFCNRITVQPRVCGDARLSLGKETFADGSAPRGRGCS